MVRQIPIIGILGGVGAGKSTVAAEFAALECEVIDGDAIGHGLLLESDVRALLRKQWGEDIFDAAGQVNRQALARKVFADPSALAKLNGILHPRIRERIQRGIESARRNTAVGAVVLDAAVLFEAGWDDLCAHFVFVRAADELRRERASGRGLAGHDWDRREKSQISLDNKASRCQYTVDNSSSVSFLREQVRRIYQKIVSVAGCP